MRSDGTRGGAKIMCLGLLTLSLLIGAVPAEAGAFRYTPSIDQAKVPEPYRLAERSFKYKLELKHDLPASGVDIYRVTFPSPVVTPTPENNTVHCEYYR